MSEKIEERMRERFKDIDIEKHDFTRRTPDGNFIEFKGVAVEFDMKTVNSVNFQFFDALREEGLEIYNVIVAGLTIVFVLYYERTDIEQDQEMTASTCPRCRIRTMREKAKVEKASRYLRMVRGVMYEMDEVVCPCCNLYYLDARPEESDKK